YRADGATIETYPGMRLDNAYSGNTVDICPVGALTLKEFRFRQRVWFLKEVPSVCAGCARGCSVLNGVSKGKVLRITPRENADVNDWWICAEGRLSYEKLYGAARIGRARVAERYRVAGGHARASAGAPEGATVGASTGAPGPRLEGVAPPVASGASTIA